MVTFSDSFKEFLVAEREKGSDIARLIIRALERHDYDPLYTRIVTDSEVNYLTMRADGLLSYLPAGKEHKTNDRGEWSREGRQAGKAGKIIRKVFTEKMQRIIPATSFEAFGNAYKAKFMDNGFAFELKPNTSIIATYCQSIADGSASLNGSCMNGDASYLKLYHECPHVQILTLTNKKNQLCGRALVWTLNSDKFGDIIFMDRIYVVEDYMYDLFLNQAKERGWWRKSYYKTYSSKTTWVNPKTDECEHMVVQVKTSLDFSKFPYIDTMSYSCGNILSNSDDDAEYQYDNTSGGRTELDVEHEEEEDNHDNDTWDEIDEQYIDSDDAVCMSDDGERRYRGLYTHIDNCVRVIMRGTGRRADTEYFRDGDENYIEVQVNGNWGYYYNEHPEIVRLENGDYAHCDDAVLCETDSEYYLADDEDLFQSEEGLYYSKEYDDDMILVQSRKPNEESTWQYLPDVEDQVTQEHFSDDWFWNDDSRLKKVQLHTGYMCKTVTVFSITLIAKRKGKRVKFYHPEDFRITKRYSVAA